jgi:hypothetical protein
MYMIRWLKTVVPEVAASFAGGGVRPLYERLRDRFTVDYYYATKHLPPGFSVKGWRYVDGHFEFEL